MKKWICAIVGVPSLLFADPLEKGLAAKAAGDVPTATRELGLAVQSQPRNAEAWFHYGTVLGWQERHTESLAALDRGLRIAPQDYDLRLGRARVQAWMGDYESAAADLEKLASEFPNNNEIEMMRGRIASWRGRPEEAEIFYEGVLSRDPAQVDALTGLGDIARDRRDRKSARSYYERALAVDDAPNIRDRLEVLDSDTFWRWDMGISASTFAGNSRSDWWGVWSQVSYKAASGTYSGRIEQAERFDSEDTLLEAG